MPTYEYECRECGHIFEVFQSITADPVKECPKCNGKVRRLIGTGIGLIFKGSGFYITDYKNVKSTDSGGQEKTSDSKSSKKKTSESSEKSKDKKVDQKKLNEKK